MTWPQDSYPALQVGRCGGCVGWVVALVLWLVYLLQYRGDFTPKTPLTMLASRAGWVMDPGSKVTYNGVQIGRVASISETTQDGKPAAKFILDVYPRYLNVIPANVNAKIVATTVFGNKYVSLTPPKNPTPQRISPQQVIDARSVTTEFNTVLQTVDSIAQKIDPVKLNLTLSVAGEALNGLGDKFGQSIVNGNAILDDVNPQMSTIRHDIQQLATPGDTYANASPDLLDFLNSAVTTARTLNAQQDDLDAVLLAATGFGNTGADIFNRGGALSGSRGRRRPSRFNDRIRTAGHHRGAAAIGRPNPLQPCLAHRSRPAIQRMPMNVSLASAMILRFWAGLCPSGCRCVGGPYPIDHFDIYADELFERAITDQLEFLTRHLKGADYERARHRHVR